MTIIWESFQFILRDVGVQLQFDNVRACLFEVGFLYKYLEVYYTVRAIKSGFKEFEFRGEFCE